MATLRTREAELEARDESLATEKATLGGGSTFSRETNWSDHSRRATDAEVVIAGGIHI